MVSFPTQDEIDNLPFKIFNKSSASPTLIIHNKSVVPQVVLKLWEKSDLPIYKALEYEKSVYSGKINPLIENNENSPFLKYIGEGNCASFNDLVSYLGITDNQKGKNFLNLVLYIYGLNDESNKSFKYSSLAEYDKYPDFIYPSVKEKNKLKSVEKKQYQCIILPYVHMITLDDALHSYSLDKILGIIKDILRGIYLLYKNNISHNDLHPRNVMIEEKTDKVHIFDWDRAYSPDIGLNPMLSSDVCEKPCSSSQCNIFHRDGYCIDFYKILFYILNYRDKYFSDWSDILDGIGIQNYEVTEDVELYGLVMETLVGDDAYYNKGFFNQIFPDRENKKCSWLQERTLVTNEDTSMDNLHKELGPYQIIYMQCVKKDDGDISELEREILPEELAKYFERLLKRTEEGFSFVKSLKKQPQQLLKQQVPFKQPQQPLKQQPKIPKTFGNLLRLKDLINSKKLILPVKSQKKAQYKPIVAKPKSIVEIIMKNDQRKLEN
jgi:serine/threonine protein kinase